MAARGVNVSQIDRHRQLLLARLRVLFADIPIQRQLVPESGNELADVELAFRSEVSTVQRFSHRSCFRRSATARGLAAAIRISAHVVVDLVFLQLEVQVDALLLRVIKNDLPLVELGNVVVEFVVAVHERPDVVAIASGVIGQKRQGIHPFGSQIVDRPDEPSALAVLPGRIARLPILNVRRECAKRHLRFARDGAVEVCVCEQCFR